MIATALSALLLAQAAAPNTLQQDRLAVCLDLARTDPTSAISDASSWLEGTYGSERSFPQQCLGFAYMSLLRWDAARSSFTAARNSRAADDYLNRARLGGMAGNATIAGGAHPDALPILQAAQNDAAAAGDNEMAGGFAADRAQSLVALDREEEAAVALAEARSLAPQEAEIWMLSATLARRLEDMDNAAAWISTAGALEPQNLSIGLEAGLIAAMAGLDEAARTSWQSVIAADSTSPQAASASRFLAQLEAITAAEAQAETGTDE